MLFGKVGRLGHGKTLRMTVDGLELAERRGAFAPEPRCWIVSNYGVNVAAYAAARKLDASSVVWLQLSMETFSDELALVMGCADDLDVGGVVLLDEIDVVWDAHRWQDMRTTDRYRIKQSRKVGQGWDLFWSAQFVDQVEKSIRNITEEVELVRAYPSPSNARTAGGRRPWFIRGQRFRPGAIRELVAEPEKDRRLGSSWHRYRRWHEGLYDTREMIVPTADLDAADLCARHKKAAAEDRCPVCHPRRPGERPDVRPGLLALLEAAQPPSRLDPEVLLHDAA